MTPGSTKGVQETRTPTLTKLFVYSQCVELVQSGECSWCNLTDTIESQVSAMQHNVSDTFAQ